MIFSLYIFPFIFVFFFPEALRIFPLTAHCSDLCYIVRAGGQHPLKLGKLKEGMVAERQWIIPACQTSSSLLRYWDPSVMWPFHGLLMGLLCKSLYWCQAILSTITQTACIFLSSFPYILLTVIYISFLPLLSTTTLMFLLISAY